MTISTTKGYEKVYGDTFEMYSREEMEEFIEVFRVRFERNNLDPKKLFQGKRCFDAGCGNGRGSLFMLMNGAEHVTSYDISEKNVESTKRNAHDFGFSNIDVSHGSLATIPFEDNQFDFVWCNGVIMHTETPNQCLAELSRILKVSGNAWIYVYGSGGVYWRMIYKTRDLLKNTDVSECTAALKLLRYPTRYVAEYIDDWYVPFLRTYTNDDFSARLEDVGFQKPELLKYGTDFDTSHRINTFANDQEKALMGEGDLRYLLTKVSNKNEGKFLLDEGPLGSNYKYPEEIIHTIDPIFEEIEDISNGRDWMKIAIAAHIQRELRILLYKEKMFSMNELIDVVQYVLNYAKKINNF